MSEFVLHNPASLPRLVQSLRKQSGLSQAEISRRLGIAQQTYSALERRADKATADRLLELLNVLGVEVVLRMTDSEAEKSPAMPSAAPSTGPTW